MCLRFANLANELNFSALILYLWKFWYGNNFRVRGPILVKRNLVITFFSAKMILVHEKNVWSKKSFSAQKSLDPKIYVITNIATYLDLMLHQHKQYL